MTVRLSTRSVDGSPVEELTMRALDKALLEPCQRFSLDDGLARNWLRQHWQEDVGLCEQAFTQQCIPTLFALDGRCLKVFQEEWMAMLKRKPPNSMTNPPAIHQGVTMALLESNRL